MSIVVLILIVTGCHDSMVDINKNPNAPTQVPTSNILSSAQRGLTGEILGINENDDNPRWATQYMQYWSNTLYTTTTRYQQVELDWGPFYNGGLADLEKIIELNTDPKTKARASQWGSNSNQIAVAKILKVWAFQNITDIWGDVPYTEALQGRENFSPKYDKQKRIYLGENGLISELNDAISRIDEGADPPEGDLIYGGDMAKWKTFANSLKLRIGMRISEVNPSRAESVVREAVSAGVISSHEESATFPYLDSAPNHNPWDYEANVEGGSWNLAVTTTTLSKLRDLNDPRLEVFAAKPADGDDYTGIPFGVESGVASDYSNEEVSFQTSMVYEADGRIMTYPEVLLLKAEAAQRGWIGGDPETYYEDGIRASMEEWGITESAKISAYLNQDRVRYKSNSFEEKIGQQLWFALYLQPLEAWFKWRRLGYPEMDPAPDAFKNRGIPVRRGYPSSESELNRENYNAAVDRQGPDKMSTRVWWDVQ
jgi:hypothetical protein